MCCSFPEQKRLMSMHASIYSKPCVCNGVSQTEFAIFYSRMHQPPNGRRYLRDFTQSAQSHQKCCALVRTLTSQLPVKPSRGPFPQKHLLYKQATLQNVSKNCAFSFPIIPFEKGRRRASASLPADTKARPRICASQRSFGTPRSESPTRPVLSRHTCSVRPTRPQA